MVKVLRCQDLGYSDSTVICGKDEQELLSKAAEHARSQHSKSEFSPEEMRQIRAVIREEESCPTESHQH